MVQKIGEQKEERIEPFKNKMNVVIVIRGRKEALIAMLCHCVMWCNYSVTIYVYIYRLLKKANFEMAALSPDGKLYCCCNFQNKVHLGHSLFGWSKSKPDEPFDSSSSIPPLSSSYRWNTTCGSSHLGEKFAAVFFFSAKKVNLVRPFKDVKFTSRPGVLQRHARTAAVLQLLSTFPAAEHVHANSHILFFPQFPLWRWAALSLGRTCPLLPLG